mgnify:CR=1 FL=1
MLSHLKKDTQIMTNLTEKIIGKELESLGVVTQKVMEPEPVKEIKTKPNSPRKTTVVSKPSYDTRHKNFKTENARHRMIDKFTSDNPKWTKDWACELGSQMRQEFWECIGGNPDAQIKAEHMEEIIDLCHRDLGQLLDHLGIVLKPSGHTLFKEHLQNIFVEHAVFNNGHMNRFIKVKE